MSRGATSLFSDLIFSDVLPEKQVKGRSKSLVDKRNELLLNRHYFFLKNFRFGYDAVLEILQDEMFISVITIPQIMERPEHRAYFQKLKVNPPDKIYLSKKWPHLVWDEKTLLMMYGNRGKKMMVA